MAVHVLEGEEDPVRHRVHRDGVGAIGDVGLARRAQLAVPRVEDRDGARLAGDVEAAQPVVVGQDVGRVADAAGVDQLAGL
jgi:hypothetical protein